MDAEKTEWDCLWRFRNTVTLRMKSMDWQQTGKEDETLGLHKGGRTRNDLF